MYQLVTIDSFGGTSAYGVNVYVEDKNVCFSRGLPVGVKSFGSFSYYVDNLFIKSNVLKNYFDSVNTDYKTNKSKITYSYPFEANITCLPWNCGSNFIACPNAKSF